MTLDGKQLEMLAGETEQEHIMALEKGELMLQWEQHRIGVGQAIEITSGDQMQYLMRCHRGYSLMSAISVVTSMAPE